MKNIFITSIVTLLIAATVFYFVYDNNTTQLNNTKSKLDSLYTQYTLLKETVYEKNDSIQNKIDSLIAIKQKINTKYVYITQNIKDLLIAEDSIVATKVDSVYLLSETNKIDTSNLFRNTRFGLYERDNVYLVYKGIMVDYITVYDKLFLEKEKNRLSDTIIYNKNIQLNNFQDLLKNADSLIVLNKQFTTEMELYYKNQIYTDRVIISTLGGAIIGGVLSDNNVAGYLIGSAITGGISYIYYFLLKDYFDLVL